MRSMNFETILGWPVEEEKIIEQCKRIGAKDYMIGGMYLNIIIDVIRECRCPVVDFSLEKHEDRIRRNLGNTPFILTIYKGSKKPKEVDVKSILRSFPPFFETIKRDLGIIGPPQFFLGEP